MSVKSIYPNPFDLVLDRLWRNSIVSRSRDTPWRVSTITWECYSFPD